MESAPTGREKERTGMLLQAVKLGKAFRRKKAPAVQALAEVSLAVRAGEVTGLVGPDGAGKTTLLRLAAGLLLPSAGSIRVLGLNCGASSVEIQGRIGYMPQQFGLYQDLTVQENLDFYADLQGVAMALRAERFGELLRMTGLAPFTQRRAGRLSGGMKQKLGLACALLKSPELLLDEPTVGVDPVSRRDLWRIVYRLVEEQGIGVLVATSYLDEADRCQQVLVLREGKVLARGTPQQFHEQVRGRVFRFTPQEEQGARALQARLAAHPAVLDAAIRSGRVRCVLREAPSSAAASLPAAEEFGTAEAREPDFADAFLALTLHGQPPSAGAVPAKGPPGAAGDGGEVVVQVSELSKLFGDFVAVSGLSFEVRRGEIFGLLGPNGAGKTTTFRMLCGLTGVSGGEVLVAGRDLRHARAQARARLGYMAQTFSLYPQLSVQANLVFYGKAYGLSGERLRRRLDWALDEFELGRRRGDQAGILPRGFQQRLALAAALLHEPAILFLDEPTSGADPLARREFWLRISGFARQGVTVVVTTHFMEEAEFCDRLLILSRGRELAQGSSAEIRALARSAAMPEPSVEDAFIALTEGRVNPAVQRGGPAA
jgi:ABC-2 type transport system ATP-binding protein